jgi:hypothetical protein
MNSLVFAGKIDRQYSDEFAQQGAQIGDQIHIRIPPRYIVGDGAAVVPQNITESYRTLTLNYQKNLAINYTSKDRTLSIDNFRERIIRPAVVEVANEVDRQVLADVYYQIYNTYGTPGAVPNSSATFLDAGARLLNEATPDDDATWLSLVTPRTQASMVFALQGLFNSQGKIATQYERGRMATDTIGFDWYHSQNMPTHTVGALGGTPIVSGASQTGASLLTSGWTGAVATRLKRGDVFTIGSGVTGVYAVNPKNRESTGELRQFVVTADAASDVSGIMTIPISPSIVPLDGTGAKTQFQTVVASPAASATINVLGAANTVTPQNLTFYPKFASIGFADLVLPKTGEAYRISDPDLGISMRVWESSDWLTDRHGVRLDILFGIVVIYPQWCVRIAS